MHSMVDGWTLPKGKTLSEKFGIRKRVDLAVFIKAFSGDLFVDETGVENITSVFE